MKIVKNGGHRLFETDEELSEVVSAMLSDLERDGMDAVRRYSRKFDNWDPPSFELMHAYPAAGLQHRIYRRNAKIKREFSNGQHVSLFNSVLKRNYCHQEFRCLKGRFWGFFRYRKNLAIFLKSIVSVIRAGLGNDDVWIKTFPRSLHGRFEYFYIGFSYLLESLRGCSISCGGF